MKSVLAKYPKLKIYYVMVGGLSLICSVLLLYATNAMSTLTAHITTNGLINISIYIDKVLLLFICFHFVGSLGVVKNIEFKIVAYLPRFFILIFVKFYVFVYRILLYSMI